MFVFFKQKTAYEMRISDWSSDVCSSDVHDPETLRATVIDSVLDFDQPSGRTSHGSADAVIAYVRAEGLTVDWLLETHAHADHLSDAPYIQQELGGTLVIGSAIRTVQDVFAKVFNEPDSVVHDGSQFDRLMQDGERFTLGGIDAMALHVPGHTPACLAYVIGDAVFVDDRKSTRMNSSHYFASRMHSS